MVRSISSSRAGSKAAAADHAGVPEESVRKARQSRTHQRGQDAQRGRAVLICRRVSDTGPRSQAPRLRRRGGLEIAGGALRSVGLPAPHPRSGSRHIGSVEGKPKAESFETNDATTEVGAQVGKDPTMN